MNKKIVNIDDPRSKNIRNYRIRKVFSGPVDKDHISQLLKMAEKEIFKREKSYCTRSFLSPSIDGIEYDIIWSHGLVDSVGEEFRDSAFDNGYTLTRTYLVDDEGKEIKTANLKNVKKKIVEVLDEA